MLRAPGQVLGVMGIFVAVAIVGASSKIPVPK